MLTYRQHKPPCQNIMYLISNNNKIKGNFQKHSNRYRRVTLKTAKIPSRKFQKVNDNSTVIPTHLDKHSKQACNPYRKRIHLYHITKRSMILGVFVQRCSWVGLIQGFIGDVAIYGMISLNNFIFLFLLFCSESVVTVSTVFCKLCHCKILTLV